MTTTQEPILDLDDIQGNIYPGFNKDHQTIRCFTIVDAAAARSAIADLLPDVSTSAVVQAYARLRATLKRQRAGASGLSATWMNLSFSYSGLAKLSSAAIADAVDDGAFKAGLPDRSPLLGDPLDEAEPGHPANWLFGGFKTPSIDMVMTVAGDKRADIASYLGDIDARMAAHKTPGGKPALELVFELVGDTLGGELNGHEHFGFRDGVSQPAIRGRAKSSPDKFIVERIIDPALSDAKSYGRPGQVLLWPGQILLGQPTQNGQDPLKPNQPFPLKVGWAKNGSFMVLRMLQQDVPAFWAEIRSCAAKVLGRSDDAAIDWVGARVVGRWRSGAPVTRTPDADRPEFVADNRVANDFRFRLAGTRPQLVATQPPLPDLPLSQADPKGAICPFAGHIRKVNPRDDAVELGGPGDTLTHLLVRRGIPYGPAFADPRHAAEDGRERGLIFVSYQASIERQFEFLMQNWVNGDDLPHVGSGRDAVLGRHRPQEGAPASSIEIVDGEGKSHRLVQMQDFIVARGGGYFFSPSITGLEQLTAEPVA
ncbi:Dyp-type peroxidase [Bradyrhizobium diazoefficiens]|nr:Dyp-type peroxidase [Bradyrhizobium diazoefficiens]MBR0848362.1 Dyp-type peroxidase [Bradyrhizobium diazoefficiens]